MSYISIISLSFLFSTICLNDFVKVVKFVFDSLDKKRQMVDIVEQKEQSNAAHFFSQNDKEIVILVDQMYSKQLEQRLERVHLSLLMAVQNKN